MRARRKLGEDIVKRRPTDQCRECHRPTQSGKKESRVESRFCARHSPAAKARLTKLQAAEKASRWERKYGPEADAPKPKIPKPKAVKNPGNIPLLCVHPCVVKGSLENEYIFSGVVCGRAAPRDPREPEKPLIPNRLGQPLCVFHKRDADDPKLYPDVDVVTTTDPLQNDGPYRFLTPRVHRYVMMANEKPVNLLSTQHAARFDALLERCGLPIPAAEIAEDLRKALLKASLIIPIKAGRAFDAGRQLQCVVSLPAQIALGLRKPYKDEQSKQLVALRKAKK